MNNSTYYITDSSLVPCYNSFVSSPSNLESFQHSSYFESLEIVRKLVEHRFNQKIDSKLPLSIRDLFTRCNLSIAKLPILEVHSTGQRGYIDFIKPEDVQPHSIIKFIDPAGRIGLTFLIEPRTPDLSASPLILTLFQRYLNESMFLPAGSGMYMFRNELTHIIPILESMINGTHEKWKISTSMGEGSSIDQVSEDTPLPTGP